MKNENLSFKGRFKIPKDSEGKFLEAIDNLEEINKRIKPFSPKQPTVEKNQVDYWESYKQFNNGG